MNKIKVFGVSSIICCILACSSCASIGQSNFSSSESTNENSTENESNSSTVSSMTQTSTSDNNTTSFEPTEQETTSESTTSSPNITTSEEEIVEVSVSDVLEIKENASAFLNITLLKKPNDNIVLDLRLSNENCSLENNEIIFTKENYNISQFVEIKGVYNSSFDNFESKLLIFYKNKSMKTVSIFITNIDVAEMISEIKIDKENINLYADQRAEFSVSIESQINSTKEVHISSNDESIVFDKNSLSFNNENYNIEQKVTITAKPDISKNENYTSIIYVKSEKSITKEIKVNIEISKKDKQIELNMVEQGFITAPVNYFTAYYDVDFDITKLTAEFEDDGVIFDFDKTDDATYTNNSCMIEVPKQYIGKNPKVKLVASYIDKIGKISGNPVFELDGYKIKATLGDYVEYFNPSSTIPTMLINANNIITNPNNLKFTKEQNGIKETFYLPLRPASNSKLSINGLSPTNLEKKFIVSQDRNSKYYRPLYNYYAQFNQVKNIQFYDATDKSIPNYNEWRIILEESIYTFNQSFRYQNYPISIEEVDSSKTNNSIIFGTVPNNFKGLCKFDVSQNLFTIWVSNNVDYGYNRNSIKGTTVHEIGHLLGFSDSAYAENDSMYSYARSRDEVTYFQPNDIATLEGWLKRN